jgi:hypothetical protein
LLFKGEITSFDLAMSLIQSKKPTEQITNTKPKKKMIMSFSKPEKMFQILEGKWQFQVTNCQNAFTIKANGLKSLELIYPKSEKSEEQKYTYKVLEIGKYYIRTQIEGEKRLDNNGNPQVWDFMILSKDEFVWHRTDWEGFAATPPVTRCK